MLGNDIIYMEKISERRIENYNHFMEQCDPKWTEDILGTTGVEIGMFAQNLSSLCLEKDFCATSVS